MLHHFTRAGIFCFVLALILLGMPHEAVGSSDQPEQLYEHAWQLVEHNYYDTSFNHQDWQSWQHKYDGQLHSLSDSYAAIKTMLSSLNDPYTRFLEPRSFHEEDDAIKSVVCGIGVSLRPYKDTHSLVVNDVIPGGPAAVAGIEYGDSIVGIDGQPTKDVDTEKAADKIRGAAGTALELRIQHGTTTRVCRLVRARVAIPAVTTKVLDHHIGYIKLATFMPDDTSAEFRNALDTLSDSDGLIIDLRDNPGGLLANAVEISDMLMDKGAIVSTESRDGRSTESCSGNVLTHQPIVVLVDHDSASASEILAGALKDNRRATLVGTSTYGKGLVQEIYRMKDGSGIHVTVARYFTPNGSDINKIGIAPDVKDESHDTQLSTGLYVIEHTVARRSQNRYEASSTPHIHTQASFSPRT